MRIIATATITLLAALASPASAQDLPIGTWNGFSVPLAGNNQNRQPFRVIIQKVPDPYVAWRGGSGELLSAVLQVGNNQNNARELSRMSLSDGRLTFSYLDPEQGESQTCVLTLQPKEGTYVGDCVNRRATLNPPAPPTPAAGAKPADPAK